METKDKKKNTLIPNTSVGVFVLGEPISNYLNKKHSVEYYEVLDEKYDSYIFYEDSLNVDVKKGVICSITCEESCYWQGRDIVRMNFKKFLETYGLQYDEKDEIILEIGKGYQTHKVYDFDELGLQIWVWRNLIRTVIVSNYQDE